MADLMLALGIHLAEGLAASLGQEYRIVAEPAIAPGRPDEATLDLPLEGFDMPIWPSQREDGNEMRLAVGIGSELALDPLHGHGEIPFWAGPTRRIDSRGAAESIDHKARIIGEGGQIRSLRRGQGLQLGIGLKGLARFTGFGQTELGRTQAIDREVPQHCGDLAEFSCIMAGDDQLPA